MTPPAMPNGEADRPFAAFTRATWRGVAGSVARGTFALSFDTPQGPVRVCLEADGAQSLVDALSAYLGASGTQSPSASGSPSLLGSVPDEGQSV